MSRVYAVMSHWSERREVGNRFWLISISWAILHVGRSFAQLCMLPTTLYFFLRRGSERRASRTWLKRVGARRTGTFGVMLHIYTFAMTIVDRVLLFSGRNQELDIRAEGIEQLDAVLRSGRGCMLLGSHLGSFDVLRTFNRGAPQHQQLKVVMDRHQNSLITRLLESMDPWIARTVIDARQPGTHIVLQIAETLSAGGMVAMLADRSHRNEPVIEVPFLGQNAPFPAAPLTIAGVLDRPVFLVFGLYEGGRRYRLVFEPLPFSGPLDRRQKHAEVESRVAVYARRLEHYAKLYPYNWFNFYDFWHPGRPADPAGDAAHTRSGV